MKTHDSSYHPTQLNKWVEKWSMEHQELIDSMNDLLQTASPILEEDSNYVDALSDLYQKVKDFSNEYNRHSKEEESMLLHELTKLMGNENGPMVALACENEQISFHLRAFLDCAKNRETTIPLPAAKSLVFHIIELNERLCDHFHKEEDRMFPLAGKMLNNSFDMHVAAISH